MLSWCARAILGVPFFFGGCAYNDHIENRVGRYDIAAEQARDTMVLTNIVRASHAEPMSFVQVSRVSGVNTSSMTLGLPSLLFGPQSPVTATAALQKAVIFGANAAGGNGYVGNSVTTSGSTNFDVSPSETKDFYRGLLAEVDPHTLEFFLQQGVSRELLFYLFTNKLLEERGGKRRELRNDPLSPDFPEFQRAVHLAMDYGLSSEPVPSRRSAKLDYGAKEASTPNHPHTKWQLCYNRAYMKTGIRTDMIGPICGSGKISENDQTVFFVGQNGEHVQLTVSPRSAFAIFQFLGRIVAAGERGWIRLYSEDAIDQPPMRDEYLFVVQTGASTGCFLDMDYEGERYCVPLIGAANTKRILSLLTQLIALNTSISDIPVTPSVRVLQ
jgi:hypothetical protein